MYARSNFSMARSFATRNGSERSIVGSGRTSAGGGAEDDDGGWLDARPSASRRKTGIVPLRIVRTAGGGASSRTMLGST